jgi:hypothetical protein
MPSTKKAERSNYSKPEVIVPSSEMVFTSTIPRKGSVTGYLDSLLTLAEHPESALKFKDCGAVRTGLRKAADKIDGKLVYALAAGYLFVKMATDRPKSKTPTSEAPAPKGEIKIAADPNEKIGSVAVRILVIDQLSLNQASANDLIQAIRAERPAIRPQQVYAALSELRSMDRIQTLANGINVLKDLTAQAVKRAG